MQRFQLRDTEELPAEVAKGASMALYVTIRRIRWRQHRGSWPEGASALRGEVEQAIEQLIESEVDRHRRGEILPHERSGPVVHHHRQGQWRMTPQKD